MTLRSAVSSSLMKQTVLRGTMFGALGIGVLMSALFLSLEELQTWGLILFIIGFFFITFGLFPYRQLKQLELNPHKILFDLQYLNFFVKNQLVFSCSIQDIEAVNYVEQKKRYGIDILFSKKNDEIAPSRFFFPYFSRTSFETLLEYLDESHSL